MRRFVTMILCVFTILPALFCGCSRQTDGQTIGRVLDTQGKKSHITRADGTLPAYGGLAVVDGDEFTVSVDSAVYVALGKNVFARIEEGTRATVEEDRDGGIIIRVLNGAVYCEADGGADDAVSVLTDDGAFVAESADFRVGIYIDTVHNSSNSHLQVLKGSVTAEAGKNGGERLVTDSWKRSRIERVLSKDKNEAFFAVRNDELDKYTLPDRYIELGEDGLFDAAGVIVPQKPSGDVSVREIGFINSDGTRAELAPDFDGSHPIYTVTTDNPFEFYIEVNHRRTSVELECYGSKRVSYDGGRNSVRFDTENDDWNSYVIYACIKAENGDLRRFTVSVIRPSRSV